MNSKKFHTNAHATYICIFVSSLEDLITVLLKTKCNEGNVERASQRTSEFLNFWMGHASALPCIVFIICF